MINEYDSLAYAIGYMTLDGQEKRRDVTLKAMAENIADIVEHGGVIIGVTYIPYKEEEA